MDEFVLGVDTGEVLEEMESFCYLGDVVDKGAEVERAVHMRVAAAWSKWREIAGLLYNRCIRLPSRGRVYDACIRSVLLYGSEKWVLTRRLEQVITSYDRRMLRHMAGVSLRDRVTSDEVAG